MKTAKPFLKWAGGKRQLIDVLDANLPSLVRESGEINLYVEPFVGGGAFLFHLLGNYKVKKSLINDINPELMISYVVVQKYPEELIKSLKKIEREYLVLSEAGKKRYYYSLRKTFNELKADFDEPIPQLWVEKASLMVALNRLCFNGLFRQNNKGEFNVPVGKYKNPRILDEENIFNVNKLLQKTEILCGSYRDIKLSYKERGLVYFDPPYRPLSKTSSFTKYSREDFNDKDQEDLAGYFRDLASNGYDLLLSNSDTGDGFFEGLYSGYKIKRVKTRRFINSKGDRRGDVSELLISNF